MAGSLEFHSFVSKFLNLWSSGKNARLAVECQAGQATVNLQLELGLPHAHNHHPQEEHHEKRVSPSRLRRRARREQARAEAAVNAAQATTAAVDAAVEPTNTNPAAVNAAPTKKDESKEDEAQQNKEVAVQAVPQTIEASVQAACPITPTVDKAVQAVELQAAQALQFPPAVADMFCPDRDFLRAGRAGHAHDGRGGDGTVHQQREEDRRQDLENLQKMLENIGKPKVENSQLSFPR